MIYQRFGSRVGIVGNCGQHKPDYLENPLTLVRVDYYGDGGAVDRMGYQFAEFLKADGGSLEIKAAVDAAPVVDLDPAELASAYFQAE